MSHIPAFPGAQGAGASTPGGRGGQVIEVTTLANHGPGSFREALMRNGPRIVVFRVGGVIDLQGEPIEIREPYLTVAGHTAPGDGILIRGHELRIFTHDVVIRYLRIRPGYNPHFQMLESEGIRITDGAHHVLIDHVSISWAQDKNIVIWAYESPALLHDITISNCLIAEGVIAHTFDGVKDWSNAIIVGSSLHPEAVQRICIHHNLMMHQTHRMPLMKNADGQIINNLIYNWKWYATAVQQGIRADIVGNVYRHGPDLPIGLAKNEVIRLPIIHFVGEEWQPIPTLTKSDGMPGEPSLYVRGNLCPQQQDAAADNWDLITDVLIVPQQPVRSLHRPPDRALCERHERLDYGPFPVRIQPAMLAEATVLADVGANRRLLADGSWIDARDMVDRRLLAEYQSGTGRIPITEADVGGYQPFAGGEPYLDSDHDGMPDVWERLHGFDPFDPADAMQDANGDGYTNLESFLYGLDPRAVR